MRKFVLSERMICCESCNGEGSQNCMGYADCIDCDGVGLIQDEFWEGDFVRYRKQDLEGWVVGFTGNEVIVAVVDDEEDKEIKFNFRAEELEHAKEG
jgi:hypothetical protein